MVNVKLRSCEQCQAEVPPSGIRMYPKSTNGTWLLCEPCCEKMKARAAMAQSGSRQPVREKQPVRNLVQKTLKKVKQQESTRESAPEAAAEFQLMHCYRCNYNFRVDQGKVGTRLNLNCPYCGKGDQLEKK